MKSQSEYYMVCIDSDISVSQYFNPYLNLIVPFSEELYLKDNIMEGLESSVKYQMGNIDI